MIYALGGIEPQFNGDYWIAENATVIGDVILENQSSVWFNAVLRGDTDTLHVGERSNVQDCAVLHADPNMPLVIGKGVTVGHKVMLHGCRIGDNSLIGINAVVLDGAVIGRNCLIGANSLVPPGKEIPDNSLVMGSPGKIVRELDEAAIQDLTRSADSYVERYQRYQKEFKWLSSPNRR